MLKGFGFFLIVGKVFLNFFVVSGFMQSWEVFFLKGRVMKWFFIFMFMNLFFMRKQMMFLVLYLSDEVLFFWWVQKVFERKLISFLKFLMLKLVIKVKIWFLKVCLLVSIEKSFLGFLWMYLLINFLGFLVFVMMMVLLILLYFGFLVFFIICCIFKMGMLVQLKLVYFFVLWIIMWNVGRFILVEL